MGKSERTKGHSYERKVAIDLRPFYPDAKRHLEYQSSEAELGQDLDNTGSLLIQCKAMKKSPSPNSLLDQVKDQEGHHKIAVVKIDRKGEYAITHWTTMLHFIQLLKTNKLIK